MATQQSLREPALESGTDQSVSGVPSADQVMKMKMQELMECCGRLHVKGCEDFEAKQQYVDALLEHVRQTQVHVSKPVVSTYICTDILGIGLHL